MHQLNELTGVLRLVCFQTPQRPIPKGAFDIVFAHYWSAVHHFAG